MHGITVTLYERTQVGVDSFNAPIYETHPVTVENVLVAPASSQEQIDSLNLNGKRAVYNIGIPKGDAHVWEDCDVEFFGKTWHVINFVTAGIDDLVPTAWNAKAQVAVNE